VIESLGVYLPPREVSTADVVAGCHKPLAFPLQRMTRINHRRMAGDEEFAIDLALKAARDCLERSAALPEDIDLVLCCNISRFDGPNFRISYEPSTASRLKEHFGLKNALAFDISNACAGMFTGVQVADVFLRTGAARRALVVSGEYITHLTRTAQQVIDGFMDNRLACLTLGDAGVAALLQPGRGDGVGFQDLEMYTLGRYSGLCIAKAAEPPVIGAIMYTDPVESTAVTIQQAVQHAFEVTQRHRVVTDDINYLFLHQTSETTLDGAVQEINQKLGRPVCSRANVVYNVAERGNTASTTHWVALMDLIRAGKIQSGQRLLFGISGSGQTVGTALYTLDDLPERIRQGVKGPRRDIAPHPAPLRPRVRIAGVGLAPPDAPRKAVDLACAAGAACLAGASWPREDVGLVIHTGIYRDEFLCEPALAAIVAGELRINHDARTPDARRTLAFDLLAGGCGPLAACLAAGQMIEAGRCRSALVLASEIENNRTLPPDKLLGLEETGSALLLEAGNGVQGFGAFVFRSYPEYKDSLVSCTVPHQGRIILGQQAHPDLARHYLDCIARTVPDFLEREKLDRTDLAVILPPQLPGTFLADLARVLDVPEAKVVRATEGERDLFTSSLAFGFAHVQQSGRVRAGDVGLVISVAAGIEVGCALYHF
jgi:3-oxoacyl-[acyl-carrier-protein] synthase III